MQKSGRLDRIKKQLKPQQSKQAIVSLMKPGRLCEGWLVSSFIDRRKHRLINGKWVAVSGPSAYATKKETYVTEKEALEAIGRVTHPVNPVIIVGDARIL